MSDIMHINAVYDWNCGIVGKMAYGDSIQTTTNEKDVTCPDCLALKMEHEFGKYKPSFPRTKFADGDWLHLQLPHVVCEAQESLDAYNEYETNDRIASELMDTIHSAETALFILAEKHGVDLSAIKAAVIKKNRDRGYYDR